jgi:hypothetical protein
MLVLCLIVASGQARISGRVALVNHGSAEVRVWREGNSWGDAALSFEALRDGSIQRFTRRAAVYTRNVAAVVTLPPGSRHEWAFDLGDGGWEADATGETGPDAKTQWFAVYNIAASPEAQAQTVWTGSLRSDPADCR